VDALGFLFQCSKIKSFAMENRRDSICLAHAQQPNYWFGDFTDYVEELLGFQADEIIVPARRGRRRRSIVHDVKEIWNGANGRYLMEDLGVNSPVIPGIEGESSDFADFLVSDMGKMKNGEFFIEEDDELSTQSSATEENANADMDVDART
jgi:hypothetical protein